MMNSIWKDKPSLKQNCSKYILSLTLNWNNPSKWTPSTNQFDNHHGIFKWQHNECIFVFFVLDHCLISLHLYPLMYIMASSITENYEKLPQINLNQGHYSPLMPMELFSTVDFSLRSDKQPSQC